MKFNSLVTGLMSQLMVLCLISFWGCGDKKESSTSNNTKDTKVETLLSKMSLEDKVGQMTQVTIAVILKDGSNTEIDDQKLRKAIVEKRVGSILNTQSQAYTLEQWHKIINKIQKVALEETSMKIPILYGIDAIHGANYIKEGTLFPHNIGMAATRNPDLVKLGAKITAAETRASGIRWNFDPMFGLGRQPLWSRFEETYGEDPYLVGEMGAAAVRGYEEDGLNKTTSVASCMKHYLGYSVPHSGKDRTPAYIPEIQLREYFIPPFAKAVAAGSSTAMINSSEINGVPVHASKYYLQDILRGELGFEGFTVSDWEDIKRLHLRHRIAATQKEAVMLAVNAGIDMSMIPMDYSFFDYLLELVKENKVSEERIDEAVSRILAVKFKLGLMDDPYVEQEAIAQFGKEEYKEAALNSALESITLLKNKGNILPLAKSKKILLAGPSANSLPPLHSSWSFSWQGWDITHFPKDTKTIKEAFEMEFGSNNIMCNITNDFEDAANYNTAFIKKNARRSDVIVLCLGENSYAESPGSIDYLEIDQKQQTLVEAAVSTGKPVIVILTQGRPRIISSFEDKVSAVVLAYRPASQGANALAKIISGVHNPCGVLPFTYPKNSGDILLYDHKYSETFREVVADTYGNTGFRPQYEFGFGLSYTSFSFGEIKLNKTSFGKDEIISVSVDVTNTGKREGKVAVDMYSQDLYASISPNVKRLRRFDKIFLEAGKSKTVEFELPVQELSFINAAGVRTVEAGDFEIIIADKKIGFDVKL